MEELIREAKDLVLKIRPPEEYGECYDTERLYNILEELEGMTKPREGYSIGLLSNVVGQSEQLVCCENCTHFDKLEKTCGETCVNWSAHNKAN